MIVFAGAVSLSPCGAQNEHVLTNVIEQVYAIDPAATLKIRNTDGSILIYGADIKEMKLRAVKRAYSAERLDKISVNVAVKPGVVSIDTKYPAKPRLGLADRSGTVDYVIILPWFCSIAELELNNGVVAVDGIRGSNVHARLGNGRLFARNCFTELHLNVTNGGLDVAYDWWENRRLSLNAEIVNGNARLFLPGVAAFHLVATAANGNVVNDFTRNEGQRREVAKKIDTMVGPVSEVDLKIAATNGSIQIVKTNP